MYLLANFYGCTTSREEVKCVAEMFGHHDQSKCEIGQAHSKFSWKMSDDRLLFPALLLVAFGSPKFFLTIL